MIEILQIINKNLGPRDFFKNRYTGNVYFQSNKGLDINKDVYNKLLDTINEIYLNSLLKELSYEDILNLKDEDCTLLTKSDDLLLVFINEIAKNSYLSTVILEDSLFSIRYEEDRAISSIEILIWEEIDSVELLELNNNVFFRFYKKNTTEYIDLLDKRFGTSNQIELTKILTVFNEIIEYINSSIFISINEKEEFFKKILVLIEEKELEKAILELDKFGGIYNVNDVTFEDSQIFFYYKTQVLADLGYLDEAVKTIESYINKCKEARLIDAYSYQLKGEVLSKMKKHLLAVNCFAYSEESYEEETYKNEVCLLKEESYSKSKNIFLEAPYKERKYVFISNNIYATELKGVVILKKDDLPSNIHFPVGHPHLNDLYICHPYKQNFYIPLKNYSEELFLDKINEFSYLLQSLGATKLNISSNRNNLMTKKRISKRELDVDGNVKVVAAKVNLNKENEEYDLNNIELKIGREQSFNPKKAPFIPNDLAWYPKDINWQRLADQRLKGNILTHKEIMFSSQNESFSTHELTKIGLELKYLYNKIGLECKIEDEISAFSSQKTEWIVTVDFEDVNNLKQLEDYPEKGLSKDDRKIKEGTELNIKKYREDVQFMLEDDNIIDENERKVLNKKVKKYGLTKEEAKKVEKEVMSNCFSESELLYIEELKDILEDGKISQSELKILDRYAQKFKLDNQTKEKINSIYIK